MQRMFRPKGMAMGTLLGTAIAGMMMMPGNTLRVQVPEPDPANEALSLMTMDRIGIEDFERILDSKHLNGDFCVKADLDQLYSDLEDEFEDAIEDEAEEVMHVEQSFTFEDAVEEQEELNVVSQNAIEIGFAHLGEPTNELREVLKSELAIKESFLITEPGRAMPDTGCALVCVGQENLNRHDKEVKEKWGQEIKYTEEETGHTFRFGQGRTVYTTKLAHIPVSIDGRQGIIRAWVIEGEAPLLLSKSLLKTLGTTIDMNNDTMILKNLPGCPEIPLEETRSGHYTWNLVPESPPVEGKEDDAKVETNEISLFPERDEDVWPTEVPRGAGGTLERQ